MMSDVAPAPDASSSQPIGREVPLIFLIAGEESGDRLGAALIAAIRERRNERVVFAGIGGHAMAALGVPSLMPIDELGIIGLAIAGRLPLILRRIRQAAAAVVAARPDVLVIIDSPDFTHRVARRVRRALPHVPIIDYVSPTVWAWRPGRARAMRGYVDHVLALLPFEPAAHRELGGPPCTFVGHPLGESVAALRPNEVEAARRLADPPLLLMLPGSRRGEIARMLPIFMAAMDRLQEQAGPIDLVLPTVPQLTDQIREMTAGWRLRPRILVDAAEKLTAFRSARAALTKSGTVTLELALSGIPTVAGYRVSAPEAWIARRVIRVKSVILANLVLGENVVPELLQEACTPDRLSSALLPLLHDTAERRRQIAAFARLDAIMQIGSARPSDRAAEIVLDIAARGRAA